MMHTICCESFLGAARVLGPKLHALAAPAAEFTPSATPVMNTSFLIEKLNAEPFKKGLSLVRPPAPPLWTVTQI